MNERQKNVYNKLMKEGYGTHHDGIGQAYYHGLEQPDAVPGVRAGEKSSIAYAAWKAGRDTAKKKSTQRPTRRTCHEPLP
jgi:hypothetical protein